MNSWRRLWLLLPLLGLVEVLLHFYFARRAPATQDWATLAPVLARLRQPGDLVVIAPAWAEPLARHAFGAEVMPLRDLARPDASSYRYAIEVSVLGKRSDELRAFRALSQMEHAAFTIRRLENPRPARVLYRFDEHVQPPSLAVSEASGDDERPCVYTSSARPTAGGLPGHVAYPRSRFACAAGEPFFVGLTVIDDQHYRPRRCIFAHPPSTGALRLAFAGVPLGHTLRGYAGQSYLIHRDGRGTPVVLRAFVDGQEVGRSTHRDEDGFSPFSFPLDGREGSAEVVFEVSSDGAAQREFCFTAEMR